MYMYGEPYMYTCNVWPRKACMYMYDNTQVTYLCFGTEQDNGLETDCHLINYFSYLFSWQLLLILLGFSLSVIESLK